jgi:hypothetical protein
LSGPEYRVAIVVDPAFGDRLTSLANRMHVWVADTPLNRDAAERIWAATTTPGIERGVTTFSVSPSESLDAWAAEILAAVELHHGEYSHNPPVTTLELHGTALSPRLQETLRAMGFTDLDADGSFIVASRSHVV